MVFAADIHPVAIEHIQKSASKRGCKNIKTILMADNAGLPDSFIDMILLFYVLHDFHISHKTIGVFNLSKDPCEIIYLLFERAGRSKSNQYQLLSGLLNR
jgi:predicted nicotinamide N-methyase